MVPSWNSKNHGYSMLFQLLWTNGHRKLAMDQHHDPNEHIHWNVIQIHDIPVKPMKYCTLEIEIQLTYEKIILYIYLHIYIYLFIHIYISNYMHIFIDTHVYIYTYSYIYIQYTQKCSGPAGHSWVVKPMADAICQVQGTGDTPTKHASKYLSRWDSVQAKG